ncbi:17S U2 SnRNP complex component HTATSF1-like [Hydra vulgaris]|uniref:17S U2 SnRNP complex component HTATSF1-like n=1 Tax=Hydra vulgaris TaxID=6087 RepID=A0ABM4BVU7_HYDVU
MSDISEHDSDSDVDDTKMQDEKKMMETVTNKQDLLDDQTDIVNILKKQAVGASCDSNKPEWQHYLEQNSSNEVYTYTDPTDGTIYEWDQGKRGWIPKIDDDFIAYYQANYGFTPSGEHDPNVNLHEDENVKDETSKVSKEKKSEEMKQKKRKKEEQEWFDIDQKTNNNVYVTGLPESLTEEDFVTLMSKCGIIMEDDTGTKKVRLYKNTDGSFKGDARCCYLKHESVDLACRLLDESDFEGSKIHVEQAVFQLKGNYNPNLKPKKKKKKVREGKGQTKLLDWVDRPQKRSKFDRIVILKNMFDNKEFENDPTLINELKADLRSECEKFGEIKKIIVFDRNPEGVASILFKEPEYADKCIEALNGRYYAKKVLSATTYDGVTNYQVQETAEEEAKRLQDWEKFISDEERT